MGVDEALLLDAVENNIATLRFYQWSEPTLSLGYFQKYTDRAEHATSRECAVVRRQTGGGAILHDRELTYSIELPPSHSFARQPRKLYDVLHHAFIAALTESGKPHIPHSLRIRGKEAGSSSPNEPFLCFERQSPGDVLLMTPSQHADAASRPSNSRSTAGWKVIGSAQRRHRGAILQHGSILLAKSPAAPELPGLRDLTGLEIEMNQLIAAACTKLTRTLALQFIPSQLPGELQSKAAHLANSKYSTPAWTKRR
jgi:lipoate-protein ligase A